MFPLGPFRIKELEAPALLGRLKTVKLVCNHSLYIFGDSWSSFEFL